MSDQVTMPERHQPASAEAKSSGGFLLRSFARRLSRTTVPFEIHLPDGAVQSFGQGQRTFGSF